MLNRKGAESAILVEEYTYVLLLAEIENSEVIEQIWLWQPSLLLRREMLKGPLFIILRIIIKLSLEDLALCTGYSILCSATH